jgi:hypothetical protein
MKIPQLKSNQLFINTLVLFSTILSQPVQAQSDFSGQQFAYATVRETAFTRPVNTRLNDIPAQTYRHFTKHYQQAEAPTWSRVSAGFQVVFRQQGVLSQAIYDEKGSFQHAIRYLDLSQVDADLLKKIRKAFPGYETDIVSEINNECRMVYLITLKSPYSMKSVLYREGEFHLIDDLDYAGL